MSYLQALLIILKTLYNHSMHYKEIIGRNRKILVLILSGLFVAVLFSGSIFLFRAVTKNEKIGWITDIHAGNLKIRTMHVGTAEEDTLYPKRYKEYLNIVIDKMKKDGVDTIVATGDNTNEINVKKAQELKKIEEGKNIKIVWIRGNHDFDLDQNKNIMPYLGVEDSNYVYDTKNVRIIALDINVNGPKFSEENLKENLQQFEPCKEPVKKHPTIVTKNIFFMIFFYFLKFILPHHTFYRAVGLPAIFCIFF